MDQRDGHAGYRRLLERLSRQSVAKHYDAYLDVPWDDPECAIDPADPASTRSTTSSARACATASTTIR